MKNDRLIGIFDKVDESFILESAPENKRAITSFYARRRGVYLLSACMLLLCISALFAIASILKNDDAAGFPSNETDSGAYTDIYSPDTPIPDNITTVYSQKLAADSPCFVNGNTAEISRNISSAPPAFQFHFYGLTVKAKAVRTLEDTYCKMGGDMVHEPVRYRVVQFRTLDPMGAQGFPADFLYLLPEDLYVDLTVYDCLIISMRLISYENYVMVNRNDRTAEAFSLHVFADLNDKPQLGNMIAFTDGIFDEGLWQNKSWFFGYQFGKMMLDEPEIYGDYYAVTRGCTVESTVKRIREITEYREYRFGKLELKSDEARTAYEYVSPFENGVFGQRMINGIDGYVLVYTRYLNGCFTEEEIRIDLGTGKVSYFGTPYTEDEIVNAVDLAEKISKKAEDYKAQFPLPSHLMTDDKKNISLSLFGWYARVDGEIYGIVKTVWIYRLNEDYYTQYYDDSYTVYFPNESEGKPMDRDSLLELLGDGYREWGNYEGMVYLGEYGASYELPQC